MYDDDDYYEPPSKSDLMAFVAMSLWQVTMPVLVFNFVQQKAYRDYYGDYEPEDYEMPNVDEVEYKTKEMEVWDNIQGLNILLWGPALVLGAVSLSDKWQEQSAWWIENAVSNLYLPVLASETYHMLEFALFESSVANWAKLAAWTVNFYLVLTLHMNFGTNTISYLRGIDETVWEPFLPSAFYKLGWIEHEVVDEAIAF